MALAGTTIWEVETTGSETLNGGAFDPGQTAGMFTDGAATVATGNSPVFTSASYNFVAGDVGAWVYVASGTNWTLGWYQIASVAANAATLSAAIGAANQSANGRPNTVAGCATTASPTGATWTIDYSQQAAAQFTYTDLVSAGTGLTVSSALKPFAKQQVGNSLVITGGTNFNTGRYVIASVAAVTFIATMVGPTNITTGAGAAGTGGLGGALASPGLPSGLVVNTNIVWVKGGTYTIASASPNVTTGTVSMTGTANCLGGYATVRGDWGTAPIFLASGISTVTLVNMGGNTGGWVRNITADGASLTAIRGFTANFGGPMSKCTAKNCTNSGYATSISTLVACVATGCSTAGAGFNCASATHIGCESYSNTVSGFASFGTSAAINCLAYANSGASSDGFAPITDAVCINCAAYNNGRDGFRSSNVGVSFINCLAESNAGYGYNDGSARPSVLLLNCGGYLNTSGLINTTTLTGTIKGTITGTASFFTNPGAGDFSLNTTAGGGAAARAAGTLGFGATGVFPTGTTTTYLDAGAAQHADPVTTGGLFIPVE